MFDRIVYHLTKMFDRNRALHMEVDRTLKVESCMQIVDYKVNPNPLNTGEEN